MDFSVPVFFLGAVGALYTIDNVYPYGQFTPFQLLVPTTAALAAAVLNAMGYPTSLTTAGSMPRLTATDPANPLRTATFDIAWPCAGIESLLIFTVVALLFLKRMPISLKAKIGYFAIGTAVTYLINILRIVAIFTIGMNSGDVQTFHFYHGPLYSIAWIVAYPLIILLSQSLWRKITSKANGKQHPNAAKRFIPDLKQPCSASRSLNQLRQALLNQNFGVLHRHRRHILHQKRPIGLHVSANYRRNLFNES
jgi:thaumarchaeosortase